MAKKVIQVPIEDELLQALDACSKKAGRSRADIIRQACRAYLPKLEAGGSEIRKKIVQVPVEDELLAALDACSKKAGRSRADVVRQACRAYLQTLEEEELDRIYIEGYRRIPEDPALGEAYARMAAEVWPKEKW